MLHRIAFLWIGTTPKAALQSTLGPKGAASFALASATDPWYDTPAAFTAPRFCHSYPLLLYCASVGTILTFSTGKALARYLQDHQENTNAPVTVEAPVAAAVPVILAAPLALPLRPLRAVVEEEVSIEMVQV